MRACVLAWYSVHVDLTDSSKVDSNGRCDGAKQRAQVSTGHMSMGHAQSPTYAVSCQQDRQAVQSKQLFVFRVTNAFEHVGVGESTWEGGPYTSNVASYVLLCGVNDRDDTSKSCLY
jgi:hypothetical protein